MSMADKIIEDLLNAQTTHEQNPNTDTVNTSVTEMLKPDPDRLAFAVFNLGSNNIYMRPSQDVGVDDGFLLQASGGSASFLVREDFHVVTEGWYGIADGGSSDIYLLNIVGTTDKES